MFRLIPIAFQIEHVQCHVWEPRTRQQITSNVVLLYCVRNILMYMAVIYKHIHLYQTVILEKIKYELTHQEVKLELYIFLHVFILGNLLKLERTIF